MRLFNRLLLAFAFIVIATDTVSAQTQSRFDWKFYNRAPVLTLTNNDDLTVVRVLSGEEGLSNQQLMEAGICLVYYGTENCDRSFIDQVITYLRESRWQWKTYEQGNLELNWPLSHGIMIKGVRKIAVTKDPPVIHTVDRKGKLVNPRARLLEQIKLPGTEKWVRVAIFEECYNVSGENSSPPLPPPPAMSRVTPPAPAPPPPTPWVPRVRSTPPTRRYTPPPTKEENSPSLTLGIGQEFGSGHSVYHDHLAKSGDVPTDYNFNNTFAIFRVEGHGFYASIATTFRGGTSNITYTDLNNNQFDKRRETDNSTDKWIRVQAGYQHSFGPIAIGGFGGWERHGLYEKYFEGVDTVTQRSYRGFIVGAEATGSTNSDNHKVAVSVSGTYGKPTRKSWTKQEGFDQVDHADQSAKSVGFRAGLDVQVYKALSVGVAYNHLGIDSKRPDTFAANERFTRNALQVTVAVKWGGK